MFDKHISFTYFDHVDHVFKCLLNQGKNGYGWGYCSPEIEPDIHNLTVG